jgi:hypothetical protein
MGWYRAPLQCLSHPSLDHLAGADSQGLAVHTVQAEGLVELNHHIQRPG